MSRRRTVGTVGRSGAPGRPRRSIVTLVRMEGDSVAEIQQMIWDQLMWPTMRLGFCLVTVLALFSIAIAILLPVRRRARKRGHWR